LLDFRDKKCGAVRRRGAPFGSQLWVRETAVRQVLESTLRPRGRPRKRAAATGAMKKRNVLPSPSRL
jgi:hypothetical protein